MVSCVIGIDILIGGVPIVVMRLELGKSFMVWMVNWMVISPAEIAVFIN